MVAIGKSPTKIVHVKFYIILMTNIKSTLSVCEFVAQRGSIFLAFLVFVVINVSFITKNFILQHCRQTRRHFVTGVNQNAQKLLSTDLVKVAEHSFAGGQR